VGAVVNPIVLYLACALAAVGIAIALPRKRRSLAAVGITLAGIATGLVLLSMGILAARVGELPTFNFYVFAAIALLASVRMITHRRPVYSALYFILTIIASCGLYLLLSAEFMAFALIIIYAGAILITYLFVIMLATQAPSADDPEAQAEYDVSAREPGVAAGFGFLLLAALSTLVLSGVRDLPTLAPEAAAARDAQVDARMALLARRVDNALAEGGLLLPGERVARVPAGDLGLDFEGPAADIVPAEGRVTVHGTRRLPPGTRVIPVSPGGEPLDLDGPEALAFVESVVDPAVSGSEAPAARGPLVKLVATDDLPEGVAYARVIDGEEFPQRLRSLTNTEALGFNLLHDHPGAIEIAGVILLMAMLGATVLARRRIEVGEQQTRDRDLRLLDAADGRTA